MDTAARHEAPPSSRSGSLIRAVALLTLAWGGVYLAWRLGWTWRDTNPVMFVLLVGAELVGWVSLALYAFLSWRVAPCVRREPTVERPVDVLVPTYDEPVEVLRATLLGCQSLRHPHTTWLLDDGRRPEMRELAEAMGVRYLTRPDNSHAKAGNINHALGYLDGELMAVLDADHVPLPDFLDALVGHFDDPEVVLVQAPHEFSNLDSVQHVSRRAGGEQVLTEVHEQSLFFRVICPGKQRNNSVFWCGSGTVLRRDALVEIGGVQTATIAEDFHTSIVLHARGGRTRYVDETLLLGLAPHDLDSFLLQRSRWARGNLRVLRTAQSPLWAKGLTIPQRLSYLGSLSHYVGGPQRFVLLVVLCATLLTGVLPLHGPPVLFAVLWAPWVALSLLSTKLLGRGFVGPVAATRFGWMTMGIYTGAAVGLLLPGFGKFKVTPKGGTDRGGIGVLRRLPLLGLLADALLACLLARGLAALGVVELPSLPRFALAATLVIGCFELLVIVGVLWSLAGHRQHRVNYRLPVDLIGQVGDGLVRVHDLTARGAGLALDRAPAVGGTIVLGLRLPDLAGGRHELELRCRVRSVRPEPGGVQRVGVEFAGLDDDAQQHLEHYCHILLPAERATRHVGRPPVGPRHGVAPPAEPVDAVITGASLATSAV